MSSYYTVLQIQNNLSGDLTSPNSQITGGKLVGRLPDTIGKGVTSAEIRIDADNADNGSNGKLIYQYTSGGTKTLSFVFKCDNSGKNVAKVDSSDPTSLETSTSPYSSTDHPLR
ncbi:hypothetical protein GP486_001748, partial [Trichoglossum hirsutum]